LTIAAPQSLLDGLLGVKADHRVRDSSKLAEGYERVKVLA